MEAMMLDPTEDFREDFSINAYRSAANALS
jgi:hypothetical protein